MILHAQFSDAGLTGSWVNNPCAIAVDGQLFVGTGKQQMQEMAMKFMRGRSFQIEQLFVA